MSVGGTWRGVAVLFSAALIAACASGTDTPPDETTTSHGHTTGQGGAGGKGAGTGGEGGVHAPACGDGILDAGEACDDGNTDGDDGCSSTCEVEPGWGCQSAPSVCAPLCGDGKLVGPEACDDSNQTSGDGCSSTCEVEYGYACTGEPSACTIVCGDGLLVPGEECDDGNADAGDGCDANCKVEVGFACTGIPSACAAICGDGLISGDEECDDANKANDDGCSSTCAIEPTFACAGTPSVCTTNCGDGEVKGSEACDDGNTVSGDGCSASCKPEPGYACTGSPSVCVSSCGDGVVTASAGEECDDGNIVDGDGCSASCKKEAGFNCFAQPSVCLSTCGDGIKVGTEECDDNNTQNGDGCSIACKAEAGYHCTGSPSVCKTVCGDGVIGGAEECDDGNAVSGDGCSANCKEEPGFDCVAGATHTDCTPICGDNLVVGNEQCDDGNDLGGDCCSPTCTAEPGCEVEKNDATDSANDFQALAISGVVKGFINEGDLDVYKITVPSAPGTKAVIKASTVDALGAKCSTNDIDSYLTIYNDGGFPVIGSDAGGAGKCAVVSAPGLAPGDYYVEVRGGTGTATFPYGLTIDVTLVKCGDGVVGPGEQCDDGNDVPGDGCDASCRLEKTPETEPNNTCATANGPYTPIGSSILLGGSITPSGDADYYAINLVNYADLVLETFDASGPGSCASIDTEISLYSSASCTTALITKDQGGTGSCSRIAPTVDAAVRHLAPGTYYAKVFPYSSSATFNYSLQISLAALCGNGVIEGSEQCDGGAGCGADCLLLPVCGNGLVQTGEQCDDGNLVSGDGCDATCQWETTAEVEPNDTIAAATTNAANDANLQLDGNRNIRGAIGTSSDKDIFKVQVATQGAVRFEMFDSTGVDCIGITSTMTLKLLDAAGVQLKTDNPDSVAGGIGVCPALLVNLAPGTYFIQAASSSAVPAYFLQTTFEASRGNEAEPNDAVATATPMPGADTYVFGDHQTGTDKDVYAVTVKAGQSIRAEVIEGDASKTCESDGIDSYLRLLDANGVALVTDDDDGRGFCSAIDGTGKTPRDSGAHGLAGGTYYIEVSASSLATTAASQFNYLLLVTVRSP